MNIETIIVGEFQVNCFVISGKTNQALIIDPGAEPDRIKHFVERKDLSVAGYLLTHGHIDHVSALGDLHTDLPAPISIHKDDAVWAFNPENHFLPFYPPPKRGIAISRFLEDRAEWSDADLEYEVITTPGHTPGSVCIYFPDNRTLFTGDTLFAGSVGRTDLPGGNSKTLNESLIRLAKLPDDVVIYPGHGPESSIGHEKQSNFFIRSACSAG